MANRWKGNFVVAAATTSSGTAYTGKANGAWGLNSQLQQKQGGLWAKGQTIPDAPIITSADVGGNGVVNVIFSEPSSNGSNIIAYTVTGSRGSVTTGTGSPIIVSGLDSSLSYTFTMTATNSIGTGPVSNTSNSVIPVIADAYPTYNILKLEGDSSITDLSPANNTLSVYGNTSIDTTIKRTGAGSIKFDGSGDYITIPNNTSTDFGTGNFTFEMWVYPLKATSGNYTFVGNRMQTGSTGYSILLYSEYGSVSAAIGGFTAPVATPNTLTPNNWHHIALTRSGTTVRLYINGTKMSQGTASSAVGGNDQLWSIGSLLGASAYDFQGNMDNIRFTKGIARYTADSFTPVY